MSETSDFAKRVMDAVEANDVTLAKNLLDEAADKYYKGEEVMSDSMYDGWYKRYETMLKLNKLKVPTEKNIELVSKNKKVVHEFGALANWLNKGHSYDYLEWVNPRIKNELLASFKYDGASILITYDSTGTVTSAVSRGDGVKGEDCSTLFKGVKHWTTPPVKDKKFGLKCEAIIKYEDLPKINTLLGKEYTSPRNAVAGLLRKTELPRSVAQYITLAIIDIDCESVRKLNRLERVELLDANMGNFNHTHIFDYIILDTQKSVVEFFKRSESIRVGSLPFMIDGIVLETTDWKLDIKNADCPDYVLAVKFTHMVEYSTVIDIVWENGSTGRVTPVAVFKTVKIVVRVFERASLANVRRFNQLQLRENTRVRLELRNDILMWLDRESTVLGKDEGELFTIPADIVNFTYDENDEAVFAYRGVSLAQSLERLLIKLEIQDIRIERLTQMVNVGMLKKESDIFKLTVNSIKKFKGFEGDIADLIYGEIQVKLFEGIEPYSILAGLNIVGVGRTVSKNILELYTLEDLVNGVESVDKLSEVIGPITASKFVKGLDEKRELLKDLYTTLKSNLVLPKAKVILANPENIVITGDLDNYTRDGFTKLVESLGHKVTGSVSKNTTILLTNFPNSGTVKIKKALQLGVKVMTEDEIIKHLKLTVGGDEKVTKLRGRTDPHVEIKQAASIFEL